MYEQDSGLRKTIEAARVVSLVPRDLHSSASATGLITAHVNANLAYILLRDSNTHLRRGEDVIRLATVRHVYRYTT